MSHDLFLFPSPPKTDAEFIKLAGSFPMKVEGREALYEHPNTGCHFMLRWEPEGTTTHSRAHLHAEVNYMRPSTFGLEAASVLGDIASSWQCSIEDPQINGHGSATTFSSDAYLRGWNAGNQIGYQVLTERGAKLAENGLACAPRQMIHAVWEWNDRIHDKRIRLQASKQDLFVPTVYWLSEPVGDTTEKANASWTSRVFNWPQSRQASKQILTPHRVMIWGDNIATLIPPPITHAIVMGPKLDAALSVEKAMRLVPRAAFEALASYKNNSLWPLEPAWKCSLLGDGGPLPRELVSAAKAGAVLTPGKIPILQAAKVLDAELFEQSSK
jgi:hypothetical protein